MKQKQYPQFDVVKLIASFLVIAIHCAPFIQYNTTFNLVYVQWFARLAVPMYFMISGFFFLEKIDPKLGFTNEKNKQILKQYCFRIFRLYCIWSCLYLPLYLAFMRHSPLNFQLLRHIFFDFFYFGTYYHLWFLPALLFGIVLVYFLYTTIDFKKCFIICFFLYIIGALITSYGNVLQEIPYINTLYFHYIKVFETGRNGLFFAPIFLVLGTYAKSIAPIFSKKKTMFLTILLLLCYGLEFYGLCKLGWMHDLSSMYLLLVPVLLFIFIWLINLDWKKEYHTKTIRSMSFLIYVSHIYGIYILLHVLHLPNLFVYLVTCGVTVLGSFCIVKLSFKIKILKYLYE